MQPAEGRAWDGEHERKGNGGMLLADGLLSLDALKFLKVSETFFKKFLTKYSRPKAVR
jgi:hypothetical protein